MATFDKDLLLEMFCKMEEIRRMDLKIAQLVKKGKVPGMTHFSVDVLQGLHHCGTRQSAI